VTGVDETPSEVHLRRILETQPVCLTRIAEDGTFLAVNDAALSMLGAERLDQVLDTSIMDLVGPTFREQCRMFLARVAGGERGSTQVELTGLGGLSHTIQLHAIPHPAPVDGVTSVLCALRDITEYRLLEKALVDAAAREEALAATHAAERAQLSQAIADSHQTFGAKASDEQARANALEQQLAEAERRHHEAAERHAHQQAQLRAEIDAAQQQLEATVADHLARITTVEEALRAAEARERELTARQGSDQATWQQELEEARAEHARNVDELRSSVAALEESLGHAGAREQALTATQQAQEAAWQQTLAERSADYDRQVAELRSALAELEAALQSVIAERDAAAADRDAAIQSRDTALADRYQSEATNTVLAGERDEALAARDAVQTERDALVLERDTVAAEREALLNEARTLAVERDALAAGQEKAMASHDAVRAELDQERSSWAAREEVVAAEMAIHVEQRRELEAKLETLEQYVAAVDTERSERMAAHEAERTQLTEAIQRLEAERDTLTAEITTIDAERLSWRAQIEQAARLARAGRLSLSLVGDLEATSTALTQAGRQLLSAVEGVQRQAVERIVASAVTVEALTRQLRREARSADQPPLAVAPVVRELEPSLTALLTPDIALAVLVGAEDAHVHMSREQLEQAAVTLVANRRAAMTGGGQVSIELADVDIDSDIAQERGVTAGPYVLLSVHTSGPSVESGLPAELFGAPAGEATWRGAGPGMAALFRTVADAGGYLWAIQENRNAVAFEIYLPRVTVKAEGRRKTAGDGKR
jgi:PAS domain S-box-containing protein